MGQRPGIRANRQRCGHRLRQHVRDKKRRCPVVADHARDASGAVPAGGRRDWRLRIRRVAEEHRHRADRNRDEWRSESPDAQRHARGQLDVLVLRVVRRTAVADSIPYPMRCSPPSTTARQSPSPRRATVPFLPYASGPVRGATPAAMSS